MISPIVNNILYTLIFAPSTLALFITYLPKFFVHHVLYILNWAILYTISEGIILYLGYVEYDQRWNLMYSFYFNIMLFSLVTIHLRRPLLTWAITFILALIFIKIFPVNLSY